MMDEVSIYIYLYLSIYLSISISISISIPIYLYISIYIYTKVRSGSGPKHVPPVVQGGEDNKYIYRYALPSVTSVRPMATSPQSSTVTYGRHNMGVRIGLSPG